MKQKQKKRLNLIPFLKGTMYACYVFAGLLILSIVFLFLAVLLSWPSLVGWVFGILGLVSLALFMAGEISIAGAIRRYFISGLYQTTREDWEALRTLRKEIPFLPHGDKIAEFEQINNDIQKLNDSFRNVVLENGVFDYGPLRLDYVRANDDGYVTYESLTSRLHEIVLTAACFRCALVSFDFALSEDNALTKEEANALLETIRSNLHYPHMLLAENEERNGFLAFVPNFDSISRFQEEIEFVIRSTSLTRQSHRGTDVITCSASIVIYPYSLLEDMLSDLRYAKRQGKEINLYLPDKMAPANHLVHHSTINLNAVSRMYERFLSIKSNNEASEIKKLRGVLDELAGFYAFSDWGYIVRDENSEQYLCYYSKSTLSEPIFAKNAPVRPEIVAALSKCQDADHSYFFSCRDHMSNELGRTLDIYGVTSGIFTLIGSRDQVRGFLYCLNRKSNLVLDSYLRESLMVSLGFAKHYFESFFERRTTDDATVRLHNVLKLSDKYMYSVDRMTYRLLDVSPSLADIHPQAKPGELCHKALFGLEEPCAKCPLKTNRRYVCSFKKRDFESSLVLNTPDTRDVQILLSPVNPEEYARDRFDSELLINSHRSLVDRLGEIYLDSGRGHVLFFALDNMRPLLKQYGSEGVSSYLRSFLEQVSKTQGKTNNLYAFSNDTFALVLPESGRVHVVDLVERIFDLSKRDYMDDGSSLRLDLSYLVIKYPQDMATPIDFLRHAQSSLLALGKSKVTDQLFFEEGKYSRPASRKAFFLDLITRAFKDNTFNVNLQPIVRTSDRKIVGAELLLRFSDEYRSMVLNTYDLINVAAENGKIAMISDTLVGFMGDLYQKYGTSVFRSTGFTRLSLNTDYSYFQDKELVLKMSRLMKKYRFPRNFLTFEINESELAAHYSEFRKIVRAITENHIVLSCDQYTGEHISLDRLKKMGFTEIKIARSKVFKIDTDEARMNEVHLLTETAASYGIKTCLVGVENSNHYNLLKADDENTFEQGFYFYRPMSAEEMINQLGRQ